MGLGLRHDDAYLQSHNNLLWQLRASLDEGAPYPVPPYPVPSLTKEHTGYLLNVTVTCYQQLEVYHCKFTPLDKWLFV